MGFAQHGCTMVQKARRSSLSCLHARIAPLIISMARISTSQYCHYLHFLELASTSLAQSEKQAGSGLPAALLCMFCLHRLLLLALSANITSKQLTFSKQLRVLQSSHTANVAGQNPWFLWGVVLQKAQPAQVTFEGVSYKDFSIR